MNHLWQEGSLDNTNEEFPKIVRLDRWGNKMLIDVAPETVGQFTGLTDKNGKRIFEGDILKVQTRVYVEEDNPVFGKMKAQSEEKRTRYWVVEWGNQTCGGASWYFYGKDRRFNRRASKSTLWNSEAEVVGNIHDSPELMMEAEA
jgi:uncharacterized phage protein (TIGR01671 family)